MPGSPFFQRTQQAMQDLQQRLVSTLETIDGRTFQRDPWQRAEGGGGLSCTLQQGGVFEKAGIMFSGIAGSRIPEVVSREHPEVPADAPYSATGVSLICHPANPHVPTVHFNVRYFEAGAAYWYGGGMDLTPYYPHREDCIHFHRTLKACCDQFDPAYYPQFKPWCDRYFFLKHRQEARGIGGIFFNYLKGGQAQGLDFAMALGAAFLSAYVPIVERRRGQPYGARERDFQCYRRGRYVEFNLLYDQGTLFGLQSGGRIESILVSLPPTVLWKYDWRPEPGSPEAALGTEFLIPRDWAAESP